MFYENTPLPLFIIICVIQAVFAIFIYVKIRGKINRALSAFCLTSAIAVLWTAFTRIIKDITNISSTNYDYFMYVLGGLVAAMIIELLIMAFTIKVPEERKIYIKVGLGLFAVAAVGVILLIILCIIP